VIEEKTLAEAKQAIFDFDTEKAVNIVREVVSIQEDPLELMDSAFIPALNEIGEMFSSGRMFLPELIQAAKVMKAVTGIVTDSLPKGAQSMEKGTVVMGTVQGDIHDIGKTLVVTLMGVNGYTIHDLGRDVSNDAFIDRAKEVDADIIGTSSLLTTTMPGQKELEKAIADAGLKGKIKTMVGGAPVTQRWANRIGADAYAENAHEAVVKANELLGK
jgi:trimethylamine corrinoid protein